MQSDLDLQHATKADLVTLIGSDPQAFVDVAYDAGFALSDAECDAAQLAAIRLRFNRLEARIQALARLAEENSIDDVAPVGNLETAVRSVNSYTQTIGIYPDALKEKLRDRLTFQGGQRLVSPGGAATLLQAPGPQDGIEPLRRMVKWITDENGDGDALEARAIAA